MKRTLQILGSLIMLGFAPLALAQLQVGDDVTMQMNGTLTGGYSGTGGDQVPSSHVVNFGADAQLHGDYYNPRFLNFNITPYYNRSTADSTFQSLTSASGVNADVNLFSGSQFPGYATFNYARNSTDSYGLVGAPSFASVGTGYGFGIGWSVLLPDKPTLSFGYAQGSGGGSVFGTNEESHSSTRTFNLRSTYRLAGWNLSGYYQFLSLGSHFPLFLLGETNTNSSSSRGGSIGVNASHPLPWKGSAALSFSHSNFSGDFDSSADEAKNHTDSSTNVESANVSFRPTTKLGLYANENFTDNLNGFLYQSILNSNTGVPILQSSSSGNSFTTSTGVNYDITRGLYSQGQITYFQQSYLGKIYNGSYLSATLGYNKRILQTFSLSASVIESTNSFVDNSLGFILNLNASHHFGPWDTSGNFSYAQNVQTLLVTYTTSFYNYGANVHRRLGRGKQVTFAYTGTRSGLSQDQGSYASSNSGSTSFSLRRITLGATYTKSHGLSILTSQGIQPIPPTPGLPPLGEIVYNGESYGGSVGVTPLARLNITASYSHAMSNTLSNEIASRNRTEIFYTQLQYRLRKISLLAGYTKFSQGISAAGTPPANNYSYFIGVSRWLNFF